MNTKTLYPTGENRKSSHNYADPLILNFKLLIEFDGTHGLFGDEKYPNTALAYLKRIGDTERYELMKHLIVMYKNFTKNLDFLVKTVEGLDLIQNAKPHNTFGYEDDKINIITDETIDMYVQSMIYLYNKICFDNVRKVLVLPSNLQHFNTNILLFASGYFSESYDKIDDEDTDIGKLILPTKKKLFYGEGNEFTSTLHNSYNHVIFRMQDCSFVVEECGKSFLSEVSNEVSDAITKNNLTFRFESASFDGRFNNILGDMDVSKVLFESALKNKQANETNNGGVLKKGKNGQMYRVKTEGGINIKDLFKTVGKNLKTQSIPKLKAVGITKINNVFGVDMLFPPRQQFNLEDRLLKSATKLFDSALAKTATMTIDLENRAKSMILNNFSNELVNGFIVPIVSAEIFDVNAPSLGTERPTKIGVFGNQTLTEQTNNVKTFNETELKTNERLIVAESENKTKLFF